MKTFFSYHKSICSLYKESFAKILAQISHCKEGLKCHVSIKATFDPKFHLVFHASRLKSYHVNMEEPKINEPNRVPFGATSTYDKDIKATLNVKIIFW